jgi:hypothetical protein
MRGRDMVDRWAMATLIAVADLERYGVPAEAADLVRRDAWVPTGWQVGTTERERDIWMIAVRGNADGDIEADDPVRCVREGPILDLLKFDPNAPKHWRLARDAVTALGVIEPQYLGPGPVQISPTPRAWLQAGGRGLCMLTPDWRERRDILHQCRNGYAADDPAFAIYLRDLAARPLIDPPPVYVTRTAA